MVGLVGRWTLMACGAAACVVALQGCATTADTGARDFNAGVVTPSDEPETRRRARFRLELAVNYFQNGQTAVALDEVKQALVADPSYADAFNLRGLILFIELTVDNTCSGTHHLHIARGGAALIAEVVLVRDCTLAHIGDDLHIAVGMRWKTGVRSDGVVIPYPERAPTHALEVVI